MHWATLRHNSDLFRAATSASSQVISILNKTLLTLLLQLVCGRPGSLLKTYQPNALLSTGLLDGTVQLLSTV